MNFLIKKYTCGRGRRFFVSTCVAVAFCCPPCLHIPPPPPPQSMLGFLFFCFFVFLFFVFCFGFCLWFLFVVFVFVFVLVCAFVFLFLPVCCFYLSVCLPACPRVVVAVASGVLTFGVVALCDTSERLFLFAFLFLFLLLLSMTRVNVCFALRFCSFSCLLVCCFFLPICCFFLPVCLPARVFY